MRTTHTDETLVVRKPRFCLDGVPVIWDETGPHKTSIVNTFSFVAPVFEKAACTAVRETFPLIKNPTLCENAKLFVQQEAQHSKVHQELNDFLFENGLGELRAEITSSLKSAEAHFNKLNLKKRLATVAAGEHIICCFSNWILDRKFNKSMHPIMRNLYLWHSLEEVEHASISFDIYTDLYGKSVASYCGRVMGYIRAIRYVMGRLLKIYLSVTRKLDCQETVFESLSRRLLIIKTAVIKSIPFLLYFAPFFHPSMLKPKDFDTNKPMYEALLSPYLQP